MNTIEILQGIKDWATNLFARQDGFYETMGVGTAVNLAGQTERTDDAMYRKSGGSEEVASGTATISNIKGNTVAWNQLIENGDFSNPQNPKYKWNISGDSTIDTDGSLKVTINSSGSATAKQAFSTIAEHIYYCRQTIKADAGVVLNSNMFSRQIGTGVYETYKSIRTLSTTTSLFNFNTFVYEDTASVGKNVNYKNSNCIDLTLIYGEGNEPTTPEQFEADYFKWFGKTLTYEAYDAGSLRSVQLDAMKTTGFNQWDEEWEVGQLTDTGAIEGQTARRTSSFIPVIPLTDYYQKCPIQAGSGRYAFYDANKMFILYNRSGLYANSIFTTPDNARYLRITFGIQYGTTYNHDICINISDTAKNGTYEPYEEHLASIPVTTLKGKLNGEGESVTIFPDGMKSAGSVYDEIYTVGDKTYAVKRVGSVDLGSLTWRANISNTRWNATTPSDFKFPASVYIVPNMICSSKRTVMSNTDLSTNQDALCAQGGIFICYKTSDTPIGELDYELKTPLVYEVDDFALPKRYLVDGGGTEEQVQKANVQGLAAILTCIYGVDAVGILNKLPQNYISEKSMDNFLAKLNIATGGTWSKTFNENTGEWDFTFQQNATTNNVTNQEEA